MVEMGKAKRVGLLATQGIRGGANRRVLEKSKRLGTFSSHILIANGFLRERQCTFLSSVSTMGLRLTKFLMVSKSASVNANLTAGTDLTKARRLKENMSIAFMGDTKVGPFDIPESLAHAMLSKPNPHGKNNSDVIRPWVNAFD